VCMLSLKRRQSHPLLRLSFVAHQNSGLLRAGSRPCGCWATELRAIIVMVRWIDAAGIASPTGRPQRRDLEVA
jgi:hypothetical protein